MFGSLIEEARAALYEFGDATTHANVAGGLAKAHMAKMAHPDKRNEPFKMKPGWTPDHVEALRAVRIGSKYHGRAYDLHNGKDAKKAKHHDDQMKVHNGYLTRLLRHREQTAKDPDY